MMVSFDEDGSISTYHDSVKVMPMTPNNGEIFKLNVVPNDIDLEKKEKMKPSDYDVFYG